MENIPLLLRYNQEAIIGEDASMETYSNLPVS
jgi:hypothetical protein